MGWLELVACNYRSDYDLKQHAEASKTDFTVDDEGKKVLPHIFELSMGIGRSLYALLDDAYRVEETRTYLALEAQGGPVQLAVFPLMSKDGLPEKAREIYDGAEVRLRRDVRRGRVDRAGGTHVRTRPASRSA